MAEEIALETGLRQLASNLKNVGAPVHLEAKLLSAFRREGDSRQAIHSSGWRLARWHWALAGGSLALLAVTLAWHRLPQRGIAPARLQRQQAKTMPDLPPSRLGGPGVMDGKRVAMRESLQASSGQRLESRPSPRRQASPVRKVGKVTERMGSLKDLEVEAFYFEPEVATEFIPFMAVGWVFPDEQQQLVRVRLPRSAMETFGLPVNRERARDPVQADVLIGEGGLVRAIRFVH